MISSLINLFFPKTCYCCLSYLEDNELDLCTSCRHKLPVTDYHNTNDNSIASIFYGRAKIENATALLRFEKKGITQQLIHQLKYKGKERVGVFLGVWLGEELLNNPKYNDVDVVIPVPLHKDKQRKRGYNQVEKFGQEIAKALNAKYINNVLLKEANTTAQAAKKRLARWQDKHTLFTINNSDSINEKHILLVDDVITTGATLEACIQELNTADNIRISIATMAVA